jgi:hypothetical protein
LLAQDQLAGSLRRRIGLVESITPNVKQSSTDAELPRERNDVVARIHPFNGLPTKFVTVPLPLFSFHFAAPFPQSVLHQTVPLQGFTPDKMTGKCHFRMVVETGNRLEST